MLCFGTSLPLCGIDSKPNIARHYQDLVLRGIYVNATQINLSELQVYEF